MDVLKLRFCSHHITELIWMCRKRPTLAIGHYSWPCHHYYYLLVSMVWSIHFGRRNSLNAYLIAQFVLLSNSKPPWTTQRSGILKTDTHTEDDGNLSNWNGWRHPEKFKSPRPSETVTMVRSCQNTATTTATTTKSQSVTQSVRVEQKHMMMEKMASQPAAASVAYVHQPPPATVILRPSASWLVFT